MPSWPEPARAAPANSGFQTVPVRKSKTGISLKNRIDSKTTEKTMPIVVMMAISEHTPRPMSISRSTALRARKSGAMRDRPNAPPASDSKRARTETI